MLTRSGILLHESANSVIYRLPPGEFPSEAILKILPVDYPPPERIARFNNELELTRDLDGEGIRRAYQREKVDGRHGLVLEYVEGKTLREAFQEGSQPLATFLDVAIKIAQALRQVHEAGIVHKDVNPGNVLVNLETGTVKLIDFGISSKVDLHAHHLGNPARLEGTLAYISPEQTGRMNRVVDYRTDFYSLGVTFYEMLTGALPFPVSDPMELVHSHIARTPEPPHRVRPGVPEALSALVGRLMAKDADDRYQSAYGLQADLEECRRQWGQGQRIVTFAMGANDFAPRFQIPQKLYGREKETAELVEAFSRVARGKMEMVLVQGYSGVGKSVLVSELHKPLTLRRGHFVGGKYDQYKRNIPYSAISQALGSFCGHLLAESEEALADWRLKIQQAVGENGQLLVDVIPALDLLLGPQPPVARLPPPETTNRFLRVFQRFIAAIGREEHPLVLFLDDLQWADSASLNLLKALLTDEENRHLLLIGAFRDNEVDAAHPLALMQGEARREGATIRTVDLQPLSLDHVGELLRDATHLDPARARELGELVHAKTGGNAFFVHQFLKALHESALLRLDPEERVWKADPAEIRKRGMTDNVVELMAGKIRTRSAEGQEVLRLASCLGNTFDLRTLVLVAGKDSAQVGRALRPLVEEGLVVPLDDSYRLLPVVDPGDAEMNPTFRFLHDRVQQAAYSLIPAEETGPTHLRIGRLLLERRPDIRESVFEIVNHLNQGRDLLATPDERRLLAGMNLLAGQRAKESTASQAALDHARAALSLLAPEDWHEHYHRLSFEAHLLGAEAHYLTGDFARAEELIHECLQKANDPYDKADVYYLLMLRQTMSSQYAEAIESARKALALLDFDLPHANLSARIGEEMGWLLRHFEAKGLASLDDAPDMTDRGKLATMKVLDNLSAPTYVSGQTELWILHVLLKVRLSIEHGNCPETGYAFSELGLIFCILGPSGYAYPAGQLSRRLAERFKEVSLRHKARSLHLIANYITPWFKPFRATETTNTESYQASLDSGELIFAGYTVFHPFYNWFTTGAVPLPELRARIPGGLAFSRKIRHDLAYNSLRGMELLVANLQGQTADGGTFASGEMDEAAFLGAARDDRDFYSIALFHVFKAKVLYLYGALEPALESFRETVDLTGPLSGHAAALGTRNATHSLTLLGLCDGASPAAREERLAEVGRNQEQLGAWAANCPENFAHLHLLVEAERARVEGRKDDALRFYDEAIRSARDNEFVHEEALANERAALYWLAEGKTLYARAHLAEALYGYERWGATRKVEQLEAAHPLLVGRGERRAAGLTTTSTRTTTDHGTGEALDVGSVMKASQALAGEMILASLLDKMMRIVMENAGAQKAALVLAKEGRWHVEAEGSVNDEKAQVLQSVRLDESTSLPQSVLHYSIRTKQEVLADDPAQGSVFARDPYIKLRRPRSVLSMPLVHQGKLSGVLYLENELAAGAFTPDRVELLRLLSSQMAVSIENARLYESVSELNRAYRRFVPHEFLRTLGRESILDVRLGDQIRQEMTVFFSDIRSYTTLSEGMTPEENFNFINAYLKRVGPAIKENGGFINQYYGDGIMAIFPSRPEDAVRAALEVLKRLAAYNVEREGKGRKPIHLGVGLHTGKLMLGVIGDEERHDTGVISDAVNTAARVEGLTKIYGASVVVSEDCLLGIPDVQGYGHRFLGRVQVKGRAQALAVYEFFDGEPPEVVALKERTRAHLTEALDHYFERRFPEAAVSLKHVLQVNPNDKTAQRYLKNAAHHMVEGVEDDWTGVEKMTEK